MDFIQNLLDHILKKIRVYLIKFSIMQNVQIKGILKIKRKRLKIQVIIL